MEKNKKIIYGALQPLNGGMSMGYENVFGQPEFIISNNDTNDPYYLYYCKQRNFFKNNKTKLVKMDWGLTEALDKQSIDNLESIKNMDIDVISYVPICSGMSALNVSNKKEKKRFDINNEQNQNMFRTTEFILSDLKPKVAVMENAPALFGKNGLSLQQYFKELADKLGYSITMEYTNTNLHGIPQSRKRTFIYFWKNKNNTFLIPYEAVKCPTVPEYLDQIPKTAKYLNDFICLAFNPSQDLVFNFLKNKFKFKNTIDLFKYYTNSSRKKRLTGLFFLLDFDLFDEFIEYCNKINTKKAKAMVKRIKKFKLKVADGFLFWDDSFLRLRGKDCICALTTRSGYSILHPNEDRCFTIREQMHLMGLPHDYEYSDGITSFQIAINPAISSRLYQSVPVTTAQHTAKICKMYLENKLIRYRDNTIILVNNTNKTIYDENLNKVTPDLNERLF